MTTDRLDFSTAIHQPLPGDVLASVVPAARPVLSEMLTTTAPPTVYESAIELSPGASLGVVAAAVAVGAVGSWLGARVRYGLLGRTSSEVTDRVEVGPAQARQFVERSLSCQVSSVVLRNICGDVDIKPADGDEITATVRARPEILERLESATGGGILTLAGPSEPYIRIDDRSLKQYGHFRKEHRAKLEAVSGAEVVDPEDLVHITLGVPPGTHLTVENISGKLGGSARLGNVCLTEMFDAVLRLDSVRDLSVSRSSGYEVCVGGMDGRLDATLLQGKLHVAEGSISALKVACNASGEFVCDAVAHNPDIKTSSGTADLRYATGSLKAAVGVSSSLKLRGGELGEARVRVDPYGEFTGAAAIRSADLKVRTSGKAKLDKAPTDLNLEASGNGAVVEVGAGDLEYAKIVVDWRAAVACKGGIRKGEVVANHEAEVTAQYFDEAVRRHTEHDGRIVVTA